MGSSFKLDLSGFDELQKALKELPTNLQKKVVRKAMRPAMKEVAKAAKDNAPVESGLLKSAIKVRAGARSRKSISVDVRIGEGDYKGESFYGAFQEYGTKKMKPKGYLRRAYDEAGPRATDAAVDKLWELVQEELKKQ